MELLTMHLPAFILFTIALKTAESYKSLYGLQKMMRLEEKLSRDFLAYYLMETKRGEELERFLNQYDEDQMQNTNVNMVSHPVDGYKLITRFTKGWQNFTQYEAGNFSSPAFDSYSRFIEVESGFQDYEELKGVILSVIKLQQTYLIDFHKFIDNFDGYSQQLLLDDIFLIGHQAMHLQYFPIAIEWLQEAYDLQIAAPDDEGLSYHEFYKLMDSLIYSYYNDDDFEKAKHYAEKKLENRPDLSDVLNVNIRHYKERLKEQRMFNGMFTESSFEKSRPWILRQSRLCRGEEKMSQKERDKLNCSYYAPTYEFYLKPMKLEMVYSDPVIFLFHNLISEFEADYVINKSRDNLDTARVVSMETGTLTTANYRNSRYTILRHWDDYISWRITKRVGRLVNLTMDYTEPLQIANYGIGGTYESHYDHATSPHNYTIFGQYSWGNRIATMLIYLSDVTKGGDTVFVSTGPGVAVHPTKGAGVFWYNLKQNGQSDDKTKHAGCPVLLGEKWIANLWMHEWGEEFNRRCSIDPHS